jgi:hypothetical protein
MATRYDKLAVRDEATLTIAAINQRLRALRNTALSLDPWIGRLRMIRDGVETTKVPFDLR